MKKKLLFGLMALVGLFASCSKDDVSSPPTDQSNSNMVSMKVEMPADFAKTRAVPSAPASHKLRCVLEVWDKAGDNLKVRQEQIYASGDEMTFTFELADQADYKAVLWADYIATDATTSSVTTPNAYTHYADKYYKTDDATGLKKVTIIGNAYTYTEQLREAFTGITEFTKAADKMEVPKLTLIRPLTKLTIAEKNTTNFALCATVKATYDVPSEFNAFTETVGATTYAATYDSAPTGTDMTISSVACKALFCDYVFAVTDATIGEISLEFTSTGADKLTSKVIPAGIPLKRNYQINAAGSLIVSEGNPNEVSMTVDMKNEWVNRDEQIPESGQIYAVGDLYPDAENPVGVVCTISNGGAHGKVVNLNEITKTAWSSVPTLINATNSDGAVNMAIVKNQSNWETNYLAFKWCNDLTPVDGKSWYLPSKEELVSISSVASLTTINTVITPAGGKSIGGYYWSSNEDTADKAFYVQMDIGQPEATGRVASVEKTTNTATIRVRAFLAF